MLINTPQDVGGSLRWSIVCVGLTVSVCVCWHRNSRKDNKGSSNLINFSSKLESSPSMRWKGLPRMKLFGFVPSISYSN